MSNEESGIDQHSKYVLFKEQLAENNKLNLNITNQLIEFGSSVYPMRNIASTKIVEKTLYETIFFGKRLAQISLLLFLTIFFGTEETTILGIIGIFGLIVALFLRKKVPHTFYGLALVTNGGTSDLFFSDDKDFILKISRIVTSAMVENKNIKYDIHIGDKIFIDNSQTKITNNINLNVEHHHGLSKEDLEFLMGDFKNTMEKLYSEISDIKEAQVSKEELQNIANEINSKEPNTSKIKKSWNIIKKACDGYDTINTLTDFGSMLGRVTMIF
ncbi:DUF6232 family protein [Aliarcobacter butzleri]|uniref:DUF6232 family protein n=1 Tax=Aliarcobacter butzleri TaxID=28197 RepID=UPI0021B49B88|nr:DUF6232 family protein [Aliarcobacter butzleri]MCT7633048.1 DUF6232 family protein [Aliarcobacter butzleri]